jgi:methionine aminopeptidase
MITRGLTIKTLDDIQRIRNACRIIAELYSELNRVPLAGQSTAGLDSFIESLIVKKKPGQRLKPFRATATRPVFQ